MKQTKGLPPPRLDLTFFVLEQQFGMPPLFLVVVLFNRFSDLFASTHTTTREFLLEFPFLER